MKQAVTPRPIENETWRKVILGVSTGFGLGYAPKAPGTFGSLLGIPLGLFFLRLDPSLVAILCIILFFLFAAAAERACHHWGEMDAGRVVSDEVLGQAIAIAGMRSVFVQHPNERWMLIALAFALFRLFDITKPFPARYFDRQGTGFGIIADDVVAGIYAALVALGVARIWLHS